MHRTQVSKHVNIARAASCVRPPSFEPPAAGALRYRASRCPYSAGHPSTDVIVYERPVVGGRADRAAVDDAVSPLLLLTEPVCSLLSGEVHATPSAPIPTGDIELQPPSTPC